MIEKMNYVTVTGPMSHLDWVIEHYLSRYEIHLEYPTHQLNEVNVHAHTGENPYREPAARGAFFLELLGDVSPIYFPMTGKQAQTTILLASGQYEENRKSFEELEKARDTVTAYIKSLQPFVSLEADLSKLDSTNHFNCYFVKIPLKNFLQFYTFIYEETNVIFIETLRDRDTVWGCFFSPINEKSASLNEEPELKLKHNEHLPLFVSYHFEVLPISSVCFINEKPEVKIPGTPKKLIIYWEGQLKKINAQIQELAIESLPQKNSLLSACHTVLTLYQVFEIKQYAAKTSEHFIFTGWMTHKDTLALERESSYDEYILVVHNEAANKAANKAANEAASHPPTKLINPPVVRWFEFFVKLYGIPSYNEIDPTPILAVVYILLFGMMFGDVGHGLGLALLGWFLGGKHQLGGIMIAAGMSSMVFGLLYGSIFGIENLIPALWQHPIENIGGTLMFAVILGGVIILFSMALNMANAIRQQDYGKLFFSPNGVIGLVFYILVITVILGVFHFSVLVLPLIGIAASTHSKGIFQRAMGTFEILLAYLTNTISFVRVGAFALSHAGMMHVVIALSQRQQEIGANGLEFGNILILVLGNLIVMAIEGLLIGIQSLRLGFYELFSRFYEGGGRAFEPQLQK